MLHLRRTHWPRKKALYLHGQNGIHKGYLTFWHQPNSDFIPFLCITHTGVYIVATDHVGHIETPEFSYSLLIPSSASIPLITFNDNDATDDYGIVDISVNSTTYPVIWLILRWEKTTMKMAKIYPINVFYYLRSDMWNLVIWWPILTLISFQNFCPAFFP